MAQYQVVLHFESDPLKKHLNRLNRGTEVTIHTDKRSYYEARFLEYQAKKGLVVIEVDRFYPNGGKQISVLEKEIVSLQSPEAKTNADNEEEIE